MKHLIVIASATALAFAGANALAQGTPSTQTDKPGQTSSPSSSPSTTKGVGATAPSSGPWTADNVTAARPFGDINITAAGTTTQSISAWAQQRSPAERAELSGRCTIIVNASNASRYPMDAQQFCRSYMMVSAANPPAGKGSSTTK